MAIGKAEHCEYFVASPTEVDCLAVGVVGDPLGPRSQGPGRTMCESCHYWLPFHMMPRLGQCDNPSSKYFGKPTFSDKPTEECFATRSLEGLDFVWCQTHRETIYSADLPEHKGCGIFVSSITLPAEDEIELRLAGD